MAAVLLRALKFRRYLLAFSAEPCRINAIAAKLLLASAGVCYRAQNTVHGGPSDHTAGTHCHIASML
jgi:hypothetical protein